MRDLKQAWLQMRLCHANLDELLQAHWTPELHARAERQDRWPAALGVEAFEWLFWSYGYPY